MSLSHRHNLYKRILIFQAILGFYAVSSIQFDKFCSVKQPRKVVVLLFLLALVLAYLASQAILDLTIYNGFGGSYV